MKPIHTILLALAAFHSSLGYAMPAAQPDPLGEAAHGLLNLLFRPELNECSQEFQKQRVSIVSSTRQRSPRYPSSYDIDGMTLKDNLPAGTLTMAIWYEDSKLRCKVEREKVDVNPPGSTDPVMDAEGILRNADHSPRLMNQYQAGFACRKLGKRLPTAHELAVEMQNRGAKGVRETQFPYDDLDTSAQLSDEYRQMGDEGYKPLRIPSSGGGTSVAFYFNPTGAQHRTDDLSHSTIWTSTSSVENGIRVGYVYELSESRGLLQGARRAEDGGVVKCVTN